MGNKSDHSVWGDIHTGLVEVEDFEMRRNDRLHWIHCTLLLRCFQIQVEICLFNLLPRSFWSTQKSLISRSVWWQWWFLKVILLRLNSADQRWALAQHLLSTPTLLLSKIHLFKLDPWRCDIEHFWMMTCGGGKAYFYYLVPFLLGKDLFVMKVNQVLAD